MARYPFLREKGKKGGGVKKKKKGEKKKEEKKGREFLYRAMFCEKTNSEQA